MAKKKYEQSYYERNKEKVVAKSAEWQKKNPEKCRAKRQRQRLTKPIRELIYAAKQRSKLKNLEFNIEEKDFEFLPEFCPVLGIKLLYGVKGPKQPGSVSLDRFDNNIGYVKGNVRIISLRANVLKNNGSVEEFEKIISYMKDQ